jgi:hypothetical protein
MQPQSIPSNSHPEPGEESMRPDGAQERPLHVLTFTLQGTPWEERIKTFLRAHPRSPRLAVLQHLLPSFLGFPAERRARAWHWVKEQLQAMEAKGFVVCTADENGVALWSVSEPSYARMAGLMEKEGKA